MLTQVLSQVLSQQAKPKANPNVNPNKMRTGPAFLYEQDNLGRGGGRSSGGDSSVDSGGPKG